MPFTNVNDLDPFQLFDGVSLRLTWGEKAMLSFVYFDEDGIVPEHHHPHEQMGIVIEGRFELVIDGEKRIVEKGDIWHVPSNVVHSARAIGEKAVALDVFSPPRGEYVAEAQRRSV